jgi:hypothetical protein
MSANSRSSWISPVSGSIVGVGGEDVHDVAAHPERAAAEVEPGAVVETKRQAPQHVVAIELLAPLDVDVEVLVGLR